jgi:hypothetical protein
MDLSLISRALAERQVDVIAGDAASALIDAMNLTALDDSRRYLPPYDAIPSFERPHRSGIRKSGALASVDIRRKDVGAVVKDVLARTAH